MYLLPCGRLWYVYPRLFSWPSSRPATRLGVTQQCFLYHLHLPCHLLPHPERHPSCCWPEGLLLGGIVLGGHDGTRGIESIEGIVYVLVVKASIIEVIVRFFTIRVFKGKAVLQGFVALNKKIA